MWIDGIGRTLLGLRQMAGGIGIIAASGGIFAMVGVGVFWAGAANLGWGAADIVQGSQGNPSVSEQWKDEPLIELTPFGEVWGEIAGFFGKKGRSSKKDSVSPKEKTKMIMDNLN